MPRILVADDDAAMRQMLSVVLSHAGCLVDVAHDGADLLSKLDRLAREARCPALVVSDVQMPGCTGLDALEHIKALLPDVPVILITAFGDELVRARARELGAAEVLDKPFAISTLRDAVMAHLPGATDEAAGE